MTAFDRWVERDNPSYRDGAAVAAWIRGLDSASWQAPSQPWSEEGYRIVTLSLSETIVILYCVEFGDPDQVDLVWVGRESDAQHMNPGGS